MTDMGLQLIYPCHGLRCSGRTRPENQPRSSGSLHGLKMVSVAVPLILRLARHGEVDEVDRLLDTDPSLLNARHGPTLTTALSEAAYHGHVGLVSRLLGRGAEVDLRNAWGRTALMDASQGGHGEVVALLVEHGANKGLRTWEDDHDAGCNALLLAAEAGHGAIVGLLLPQAETGGEGLANAKGETALWLACYAGHTDVVRVLLMDGASAAQLNVAPHHHPGWTPKHAAKGQGHRACVDLIEWFEGEMCRVATLRRARVYHDQALLTRQDRQQLRRDGIAWDEGKGPGTKLGSRVRDGTRAAVASFVVHDLPQELFLEIVDMLDVAKHVATRQAGEERGGGTPRAENPASHHCMHKQGCGVCRGEGEGRGLEEGERRLFRCTIS